MLNKFIGVGMVGSKGVELRYTPNGKATASFSLGIKRQFKNQEGNYEWDNLNVVVWGKQAEACANYLSRGKLAAIDGRLQIRTYEGQDGQKKWVTEVVAQEVKFLSPKSFGSDFIGGEVEEDPESLPF